MWMLFLSISVLRVTCYDHFCVFQFFSILAVSMAMATIFKIQKLTDFNGNEYLQGVRHTAPYGDHFEPKMATKIQKSSDLGEIWFPT